MIEILIEDGLVVDGTGVAPVRVNLGIASGKIAFIGADRPASAQVIRANGQIVAPGFVDSHAHDDVVYFWDPDNFNKLSMGVTTTISGNCGESFFPVTGAHKESILDYFSMFEGRTIQEQFTSTRHYFDALRIAGPGLNAGAYVGHGTLRIGAMGYADREPDPEEYAHIERLLAEAMESGAYGLSSGLLYPPGSFSQTSELVRLCKIVAKYDGTYVSHLRHEGDYLLSAVDEAIEIGRQAGVRVILSHLKVMGKKNQGLSCPVLERIEAANREGLCVSGDVYPYEYGATYLPALLPPALLVGGFDSAKRLLEDARKNHTLDNIEPQLFQSTPRWVSILDAAGYAGIRILTAPQTPEAAGMSLAGYAVQANQPAIEALADLFIANDVKCMIAMDTNNREDMERFIQHPNVAFGSDGVALDSNTVVHPRTTGAFTKVLRETVREKKSLPLQEAVRKMTSLPCDTLGIPDRGRLKPGCAADVVIFDPDTVAEQSTLEDPAHPSVGIETVLVNGKIKYAHGVVQEGRAGSVLVRR